MSAFSSLFDLERRSMAKLLSGLIVASISGFITYIFSGHGIWQQWTYLLHTFSGIYLAIVFTPYIAYHFKRTLGIKRPTVVLLGLAGLLFAIALIATGLHISVFGQLEARRWIYSLHIVSSYILLLALVVHLLAHRLLLPVKRKTESSWFASITFTSFKPSLKALGLSTALVLVLSLMYSLLPIGYSDEPVITPYEYSFGKNPFLPAQVETEGNKFVDIKQTGASNRCASCHQQISDQWKSSLHAKAASDKAYQTNVKLLTKNKGMAAARFCEGCHAPVPLLSGQLTPGGVVDTPGHLDEGISCMTCHGMDKVVHLQGNGSYKFAAAKDYLFGDRHSGLPTKLHNYILKIQPRQHRLDMGRAVLKNPQSCATCHAGFMDKDMNNWGWVKLLDEYAAWLDSPYSGQSKHSFAEKTITRCQDCHFPLATIDDPSSDASGRARSHRSLGANTAIPFIDGDKKQLALVSKFLQENKVRVSIERPNRKDATRSRAAIAPTSAASSEAPWYYYLGEQTKINVIVSNTGVGHSFPGGTTDINEAWIHFRVVDSTNRVVFESGTLDPNNHVSTDAHFYKSTTIDRQGKEVWRHDLFNMVGDSFKRTIPAGGADIARYEFSVPVWAKGPLTASAVLRYRKFNQRYAQWALKDESIRLPIVDMASDTLAIPLRIRKEASAQ